MSKNIIAPRNQAVIAMGVCGRGCVLFFRGPDLKYEIRDNGVTDLGDLGLDDAPSGLLVWEGHYYYEPEYAEGMIEGYTSHPVGTFRSLTEAELDDVNHGIDPWDELDDEEDSSLIQLGDLELSVGD